MKWKNDKIKDLHEKYIESIFQLAKIENKAITFPNTYEILTNLQKAKTEIPQLHIDIVLGIKNAYKYVIEIANTNEPITSRDFRNINKLINEYETFEDSGLWRTKPVGITATKYVPPIKSGDEYIDIINKTVSKTYSFLDIVELCVNLIKLQPFSNGNKRTCLCFANALLASKGLTIIQIHDYIKFIEKLINYYNDKKNIKELVIFICKESNFNKTLNLEEFIIDERKHNPKITIKELSQKSGASIATINRKIKLLK